MKVEIKESLKVGERAFKAPVLVYETLDEALKAAGSQEVVVNRLNGFLHAHGSAGDLRDLIVETLEEVSGVAPLQKDTGKKSKDGKPIMEVEKELAYVSRVISAKPDLFDKVQASLDKKARGYKAKDEQGKEYEVPALQVDIKLRPPAQKGPKKLADKWKEVALAFLQGKKSLEKFNKALGAAGLNTFTAAEGVAKDDVKNVEALGWLCKAYQDAQDAFKNM